MVTKRPGHLLAAVLLLFVATLSYGAPKSLLSQIHGTAPSPELLAAARSNNIPVQGLDSFSDGAKLNPGDSITALVILDQKGKRITQWLLYLKATAPDSLASTNNRRIVMHSATGSKHEFVSTPAPVSLQTLGPFDASQRKRVLKRQDKTASFKLDQGFLALGLDHAAIALMRLRQTGVKGSFGFSDRPFSEAAIAKTLKSTKPIQLTMDEERALAGSVPALMSYFNIVQRTEGLSDILFELIDLPSMWSMMRKGGVDTGFRFVNQNLGHGDSSAWNLPATAPVYNLPLVLELNKHPSLNLTFVVTAPRPPLLPCAGVVALVAEKPGDKNTFLTLRIISARRAAP
jgi:hypothetical protein